MNINNIEELRSIFNENVCGVIILNVKTFINKCFDKELLVVSAGPEIVRLLSPLNVTIEKIDNVINIFESVAAELS